MSRHRIELRPAAVRSLRKLDPQIRGRVQGAIALLADDPHPPAARVFAHDMLLVVVVALGHRRDVYDA